MEILRADILIVGNHFVFVSSGTAGLSQLERNIEFLLFDFKSFFFLLISDFFLFFYFSFFLFVYIFIIRVLYIYTLMCTYCFYFFYYSFNTIISFIYRKFRGKKLKNYHIKTRCREFSF